MAARQFVPRKIVTLALLAVTLQGCVVPIVFPVKKDSCTTESSSTAPDGSSTVTTTTTKNTGC